VRGKPRRGGVTSRARKEELRRAVNDVTRGKGESAARSVDEGVRAGKGELRRDRWTRGSAMRRGIHGKRTVLKCEKDSASCGKRIALSVRRG